MKTILSILVLSFLCVACQKDYECTTVIIRTDNNVELATQINFHNNRTKKQIKDIEGVQYKTYLGMDATYLTTCEKQ